MSSWSLKELEEMPEAQWRVYIAMRFDTIESTVQHRSQCPILKATIGTLVASVLGAAAWLFVKVFG